MVIYDSISYLFYTLKYIKICFYASSKNPTNPGNTAPSVKPEGILSRTTLPSSWHGCLLINEKKWNKNLLHISYLSYNINKLLVFE